MYTIPAQYFSHLHRFVVIVPKEEPEKARSSSAPPSHLYIQEYPHLANAPDLAMHARKQQGAVIVIAVDFQLVDLILLL